MLKHVNVLLVEDSPGDIELVKLGFEEIQIETNLTVITDGKEAHDYLATTNTAHHLILLDLNLPRMSGFELLKFIRSIEKFKLVPVLILTSSDDDKDILESYSERANGYIEKPVNVNEFIDSIASIEKFWLKVAKLPSGTTENASDKLH